MANRDGKRKNCSRDGAEDRPGSGSGHSKGSAHRARRSPEARCGKGRPWGAGHRAWSLHRGRLASVVVTVVNLDMDISGFGDKRIGVNMRVFPEFSGAPSSPHGESSSAWCKLGYTKGISPSSYLRRTSWPPWPKIGRASCRERV